MNVIFPAFLIGVVAGLRTMTAPAAVSCAARKGSLQLAGTSLGFLEYAATPIILSLLAAGELVGDKLPNIPDRTSAIGFSGRVLTGGLSGAAIGAPDKDWLGGLVAGVLGAVVGTLGGYEARTLLVRATGGKDLPIALLEDVVAIGSAFLIVRRLSATI